MATKQQHNFNKEKLKERVKQLVHQARTYTPKVGVFGNSGVGKSSLCNALFGQDVAEINDVEACTRNPQHILIGGEDGAGGIILVDLPGIGEDPKRQKEYTNLYKSLVPELDMVIWAIKADDRNYASALDTYNEIFQDSNEKTPILFVITQCDKTNDSDDWNRDKYCPEGSQVDNIIIKEHDVSKRFNVSTKQIVSIAVKPEKGKSYQVDKMLEMLVDLLPNKKKFSFAREAKEENVTEDTAEKAEKGIWDYVKETLGDSFDYVKDFAREVMSKTAGKLVTEASKWIKKLF